MNHRVRAANDRAQRGAPARLTFVTMFLVAAACPGGPLRAQAAPALPFPGAEGAALPRTARPGTALGRGGPVSHSNASTNAVANERTRPIAAEAVNRGHGQRAANASARPAANANASARPPMPAPSSSSSPAQSSSPAPKSLELDRSDLGRTVWTVAFFALISLAPIGLLMVTAFVRINIVLTLLRQALGSPQVPGNQVLMALALLLTALVMWPRGEAVYHRAIGPYLAGRLEAEAAWSAAVGPIKTFMVEQIVEHHHEDYLASLYDRSIGTDARVSRREAAPDRPEDYPLRIVMPAFLLGELTTALLMGFYIYLPFLVIDLVVSAVLATTGLLMLPPSLVSTPAKLVLFVLADGWRLVAEMLLESFRLGAGA